MIKANPLNMRIFLSACFILSVLLFASCVASPPQDTFQAEFEAPLMEKAAGRSAPMPEAASDSMAVSFSNAAQAPEPTPASRQRIYSASVELEVTRTDEALKRIESMAKELDGRIDGIYPDSIIVRVPAAGFLGFLRDLESVGKVLDKRIDAFDVTDRLADTETRLRLATEARERLYLLLERAEDTEERLKILREIRRLTETIEAQEAQLMTLRSRIAFSRVSIALKSRTASQGEARERIPFSWMRELDPFAVTLPRLAKRLPLDLGADFAVFKDPPQGEAFYAEGAGGSIVRLGSIPNEPDGDAMFWQKSMLYYLTPLFAELVPMELAGNEPIYGVSCRIPGSPGFRYEVYAVPRKGELYIAEGVFPESDSPSLMESFHAALMEVLP
ncbi:hypothetical protein B4O97_09040 [Marispirochaeta aestuarii]|uniref:DUF4349 domain-containing protein n=1 Tax=Marispirochaeta aestuarii TaxID=1963862 RepID=A0A1Y1RY07_9SPIO|nr:DUF4349 domain-containing protein [Marispirochaeta aestuarii]ORC35310.1 hypothetical protein B4O97_09040 [Marispirochaeta aestuarii]